MYFSRAPHGKTLRKAFGKKNLVRSSFASGNLFGVSRLNSRQDLNRSLHDKEVRSNVLQQIELITTSRLICYLERPQLACIRSREVSGCAKKRRMSEAQRKLAQFSQGPRCFSAEPQQHQSAVANARTEHTKLPVRCGAPIRTESCSGCEGLGRGPVGMFSVMNCLACASMCRRSEWLCRLPSGLRRLSTRGYEVCARCIRNGCPDAMRLCILEAGGKSRVSFSCLLSLLGSADSSSHLSTHSKRRKLLASRSCPCSRRPCCARDRHVPYVPIEEVARLMPGRATCPRGFVSVGGDCKSLESSVDFYLATDRDTSQELRAHFRATQLQQEGFATKFDSLETGATG